MAVGVMLATRIMEPSISCDDSFTLIIVVLVLSFLNTVLRPLLLLFSLPFIILTMGLGVLVVNALTFMLVGFLVPGFHVSSFWAALGGSLIVSLTNMFLSLFIRRRRPPNTPPQSPSSPKREKPADVIDI